jgi:predicted HicB family RNase H-like nuclease
MTVRQQISMPPQLKRRAKARAARQGISLSEYLRRLIAQDLGPPEPERKPDI